MPRSPALSRAASPGTLGSRKQVIVVTDAVDALWTKDVASGDGLRPTVAPAVGSKKLFLEEFGALWRQSLPPSEMRGPDDSSATRTNWTWAAQ